MLHALVAAALAAVELVSRAARARLRCLSMVSNYFRDGMEAIRSQLPETDLPAEGADSLLAAYALVLRLRGRSTSERDIHDAWAAWKTCSGHPHADLLPFDALDEATRHKDRRYADAVRRAAEALEHTDRP